MTKRRDYLLSSTAFPSNRKPLHFRVTRSINSNNPITLFLHVSFIRLTLIGDI
jgi:hypothetical protein